MIRRRVKLNDDTQFALVICFAILIGLLLFSAGASYFDLAPPLMLDLGDWASNNMFLIAFVFCFFMLMVTIIKIRGRKHE